MLKKIQHDNSKKWILWVILTLTFLALTFVEIPYLQNSTVTPKWIIIGFLCFQLYFVKSQRVTQVNKGLIIWFIFVLQYGLQCFRSYNFWDSLVYVIPLLIVPIFTYLLACKLDEVRQFYSKLSLLLILIIIIVLTTYPQIIIIIEIIIFIIIIISFIPKIIFWFLL